MPENSNHVEIGQIADDLRYKHSGDDQSQYDIHQPGSVKSIAAATFFALPEPHMGSDVVRVEEQVLSGIGDGDQYQVGGVGLVRRYCKSDGDEIDQGEQPDCAAGYEQIVENRPEDPT